MLISRDVTASYHHLVCVWNAEHLTARLILVIVEPYVNVLCTLLTALSTRHAPRITFLFLLGRDSFTDKIGNERDYGIRLYSLCYVKMFK